MRFLDLPGYRIEYASSGWGLAPKIAAQIPKLLSAIKEEQAWLQKVVDEEKIDAVISDNRYGLRHPQIHSVFVTHQLRIKAPFSLADDFLQELNYRYLNAFNECWIPDAGGDDNLAGDLSHPAVMPAVPVSYTGPLSRFAPTDTAENGEHLLLLLSGPEPQRTLLENLFLDELKTYKEPVVMVRGLPGNEEELNVAQNVSVFPHLPAKALQEKISNASLVIARCGYSTVMDLAALKKKSILIPTPGQTEQEYLSAHLMKKNFALCVEQKKFRLKNALALAENFSYQPFPRAENNLENCVASFLKRTAESKASSV